MKILCVDTSNSICAVALLEDKNLINKTEKNNGLTHSETLMPIIEELLSASNTTLKDIDLLVCDIGPGSFTGIRIGIATAKAFADTLNIPTIGISSLEVLAYNIKDDGLICSTIDCKNDNCYFALYELKNNIYNTIESPSAKTSNEVIELLKSKYLGKTIYFVGDGIKEKSSDNYLNIENLGIAGFNKFINNNQVSEDILPLYLKKPQAQRQLEEKLKSIK